VASDFEVKPVRGGHIAIYFLGLEWRRLDMSRTVTVVSDNGKKSSLFFGARLSFLLILLLMGGARADHGSGPSPAETVVSLGASGPTGVDLRASISGLSSRHVLTKGGTFESLEIPGEGITAQVGKPRLPVIRRLVEIPFGATLTVELGSVSIEERTLHDLGLDDPIVPQQAPVLKIPGAAERAPFVIDERHYDTDAFWPPDLVKVKEIGVLRQSRLALVEIFPVRYNSRRGLVRLCSSAEFQLVFQDADLARTRSHRERYGNLFSTRSNSSRLFIEPDPPQPSPLEGWSADPVGYLIVVGDDLYEAIQPLVDWKRLLGFQVTLVKASQAGSDKIEIKDYVKNAYENWDIPPTFLLLVGDVDRIPTYDVGGITTDLYYTTMSPGDYFPDIQIGRLSAADPVELAGVVEKIVEYEKGLWDLEDQWTRRGYFMASNDSWYHGVAEGTQDYSMHLARAYGMICDSLYAYYGTGTPVSTALDDGRSLAVYSGHGNFYGWQGPTFTQSNVQALQNGQMYPLVCSHACMTGGYHKDVCFGETWLRAEEKGAASFWGATVSTYWEEDDILQRHMFDALFDSTVTWLSGMMDRAKMELYVYYGGAGLSENYYKKYNLLGDPSMHLWIRPPRSLVVNHAADLPLGASSFVVNVWQPRADSPGEEERIQSTMLFPVDDALTSITMDGELYGEALTIGGVVSVKMDPPPLKQGPLEIAVSKPGFRPYLGSTEVLASGPYLLYQSHYLDDSATGNGDGQANAGETIQLRTSIRNMGNEQACRVTALLATEDPYIQVARSTASFGNILPADSSFGLPPYECQISELCPSGHEIAFTLAAMDSMGRLWSSDFQIRVVSPMVRYHQHQIQDDQPGGNGNGVAEVGETVKVVVTLRNDGLGGAMGVTAVLTSVDPHIQVLSNSSVFGDLLAGAQSSGSPPYQVVIVGGSGTLLSHPLVLDMADESGYTYRDTLFLSVGTPGFSDDMESQVGDWAHVAVGEGYVDHWHLSQEKSHSGSQSWKCGDAGDGTYFHNENSALISPAILLADNSTLTFWHWMEAEVYNATRAWDAGAVEISIDEGSSWQGIAPVDGYPYTIWDTAPSAGSPFEVGTPCFSGSTDWKQEQFDLSAYSGLIHLRFRFGSDDWTEKEGWYIDDVQVSSLQVSWESVSDLQIFFSAQENLLVWSPAAHQGGSVRYEIYRSHRLTELTRPEHRLAVVSEPRYADNLRGLAKSEEGLFYSVVAVDAWGRRSPPSEVVGRWKRSVGFTPKERR
jgi:hypothetical protein